MKLWERFLKHSGKGCLEKDLYKNRSIVGLSTRIVWCGHCSSFFRREIFITTQTTEHVFTSLNTLKRGKSSVSLGFFKANIYSGPWTKLSYQPGLVNDGTLALDLRKSFKWRGTEGLIHGQNISGLDTRDGRGDDRQVIGEVERGCLLSLDLPLPRSNRCLGISDIVVKYQRTTYPFIKKNK